MHLIMNTNDTLYLLCDTWRKGYIVYTSTLAHLPTYTDALIRLVMIAVALGLPFISKYCPSQVYKWMGVLHFLCSCVTFG